MGLQLLYYNIEQRVFNTYGVNENRLAIVQLNDNDALAQAKPFRFHVLLFEWPIKGLILNIHDSIRSYFELGRLYFVKHT